MNIIVHTTGGDASYLNIKSENPNKTLDNITSMVLGCLSSASLTEHKRYLGGRKWWQMRPPTKPTRVDKTSAALQRAAEVFQC